MKAKWGDLGGLYGINIMVSKIVDDKHIVFFGHALGPGEIKKMSVLDLETGELRGSLPVEQIREAHLSQANKLAFEDLLKSDEPIEGSKE